MWWVNQQWDTKLLSNINLSVGLYLHRRSYRVLLTTAHLLPHFRGGIHNLNCVTINAFKLCSYNYTDINDTLAHSILETACCGLHIHRRYCMHATLRKPRSMGGEVVQAAHMSGVRSRQRQYNASPFQSSRCLGVFQWEKSHPEKEILHACAKTF